MNRLRLPTTAQVGLALPWIVAVVAARLPLRDNSFLWHIAAGRAQIDQSTVLVADPFSFTFSGQSWRTQSWLADLGYAALDPSGLDWVPVFLLICTTVLLGATGLIVYRSSRSIVATAAVQVATAWVLAGFLNPRPVIFSFVLFALVILAEADERLRWVLPLLIWLWAGLHGSFIVGIGYLILQGLRRRRASHGVDAIVCAVAATLTAHGWGVWEVLADFASNQGALDFIVEWATPDFVSPGLLPFLGGVLILIVGGTRGKLSTRDHWVIAPALYFSATAARAVPIAWLMLLPFIGASLTDWAVEVRRRNVVNLALALIVIVFPFWLAVQGGLDEKRFPLAASEQLGPGRTFHDDVVGGYLIYKEWPDLQVFADDRAELYGADFFREMVEVRQSRRDFAPVFARYQIVQALLRVDDSVVADLQKAGWRSSFKDENFIVLVP